MNKFIPAFDWTLVMAEPWTTVNLPVTFCLDGLFNHCSLRPDR